MVESPQKERDIYVFEVMSIREMSEAKNLVKFRLVVAQAALYQNKQLFVNPNKL